MTLPRLRSDLRLYTLPQGATKLTILMDPSLRQHVALDAETGELVKQWMATGDLTVALEAQGYDVDAGTIEAVSTRFSEHQLLDVYPSDEKRREEARRLLEDRTWSSLRDLIRYATQKIPFYRERYAALGITAEDIQSPEDFRRLPFVTRDDIHKHFPEGFLPEGMDATAAANRGEIVYTMSSGTSGERLVFASSEKRRTAQELSGQLINGVLFQPDQAYRAALFTTLRCAGMICARDTPQFEMRVSGQIVTLLPPEDPGAPTLGEAKKALQEIQAHRATWLVIDPCYLVLLSHLIQDNKLRVPKLSGILSGFEMLSEIHRRTIEEVWGCQVFQHYTASDVGKMMMIECDHKTLHVNQSYMYTELLVGERPAGPGELAMIVQTTLKETIPLIRYRTNDLAYAADRSWGCPCGSVTSVVKALAGRARDSVTSMDGRMVTAREVDWVLTPLAGIRFYQLVQTDKSAFNLKVIVDPRADGEEVCAAAGRAVSAILGEGAQIETDAVRRIYPDVSGKFRLAYSEWTPAP